jgi:HK97 family phage portal protein
LIKKLGGSSTTRITVDDIMKDKDVQSAMYEVYLRELAFWTCVNKIANAISKCEFKTYIKKKEVKGQEYYLWNYEPNQNQNATSFMNKLIGKLYRNNECLVVEVNNHIYVADSYSKEVLALKEYRFSGITFDGYELSETREMSEVMFFELNSENMRNLTNGMYETYSKLLIYAQDAYKKSRGKKGILNIGAIAQESENFDETFQELMSTHFKNFFESDSAVLPLFDGYEYQDISESGKTYSTESTRDIKSLADDIFEFTARAFSFPPSLAKGDVQDTGKAIDELLTFVIDPLIKMLQQEINRKRNGYTGFKAGNYVKIETLAVKHIDIFDIATPVDKLISSGAFTINDILEVLGKPRIEEDWANQHFMTKNYSKIQDLLAGLTEVESG